jgi:glycosyltransferase involved in cell wall biosynthesis
VVKRVGFAVPGDLATPTGGYAYDSRIITELRQLGWQVDVIDLGAGYPRPTDEQRAAAPSLLGAMPPDCPIVIDGLAFGVLPEAAEQLRDRPLIGLVHHPLAFETGLPAAVAKAFHDSERRALATTRAVIVTSDSTAKLLVDDFEVPAARITVARPGNDLARPPALGSSDGLVRLLCIGSLVPLKGYDVLIAALASLPDLPWRLSIVGDRTRHPETAARVDADIARFALGDRIEVLGAVPHERLAELYVASDIFVLASRFEGYGMALSEAIAHGVPVVSTTAGAIPQTVPADAGLLVPPDDVAALASALRRLIERPDERRRLAVAARAAAARLPTWPASARLFARAIETAA